MIHHRRMQSLEVFVYPGRSAGEAARSLAQDLRRTLPDMEIMIQELPVWLETHSEPRTSQGGVCLVVSEVCV